MDSRTQNKYGKENNSSVVELSENDFDGVKLIHPNFRNKYSLLKISPSVVLKATVILFVPLKSS